MLPPRALEQHLPQEALPVSGLIPLPPAPDSFWNEESRSTGPITQTRSNRSSALLQLSAGASPLRASPGSKGEVRDASAGLHVGTDPAWAPRMLASRLLLGQAPRPEAPPRAHMRMERLSPGLGPPGCQGHLARDHICLAGCRHPCWSYKRTPEQPEERQPSRTEGGLAERGLWRGSPPQQPRAEALSSGRPSSRDTTEKGDTCAAPRTPQTPRPLHQPPPAMGLGTATSQAGPGQRPPVPQPWGGGCFLQPPSGCGAAGVLPTGREGRPTPLFSALWKSHPLGRTADVPKPGTS